VAGLCTLIGHYLFMRLLLTWILEFALHSISPFFVVVNLRYVMLHVPPFCENCLECMEIHLQVIKESPLMPTEISDLAKEEM